MPQISIIVPIYKVDQYLQRCVDSILAQTFTEYELILIDDGSPDMSGPMDDEYAVQDDRIISIHHKNGGVSSARNAGLDIARGEYVTFIDPDDYVLPNYLEELFHPEYDLVCQTVVKVDESGAIIQREERQECVCIYPSENDIVTLLYNSALKYAPCKCYKNYIIQCNGIRFNTDVDLAEDTLFSTQYARYATSVCVQNIANYQYVRYDSRTTLDGERTRNRLCVIKKAYYLISEAASNNPNMQQEIYISKLSAAYWRYLHDCYTAYAPFQIAHRLSCLWYLSDDQDFHNVLKSGTTYCFSNEMCQSILSGKKIMITFAYLHYCLFLLKQAIFR